MLPGHDRPAFVRKRRSSCFRLPRLFDPRPSYSEERTYRCVVRSPSRHRSDSHHTTVFTDQPVYVNDPSPQPSPHYLQLPEYKIGTGKHTCGACGKFRSPSYCKRHPLPDGEQPKASLCRKCAKGSTDSGSDDSNEKYRKKQRRRRRQAVSSSDERFERHRRERRYRGEKPPESGDYSYKRYCREKETYKGPRRSYSIDERSSHSDWEPKRQPRVVYLSGSSSRPHTESSSASVVVSYKSSEPRRLRRSSKSRSSAEEIRVVRRIIDRPERKPRPLSRSMSERSHRSHYRSVSGSSGKSVRFRSPIRRYRGRGYDGVASYGDSDPVSLRMASEPLRVSLGSMDEIDQSVYFERTRLAAPQAPLRQRRDSRDLDSGEQERPRSRTVRHIRGSSEIRDAAARYKRNKDGRRSSTTSLMSGARGRSISADRRALERAKSRERWEGELGTGSLRRHRTSSDDSSATYVPRTYLS